MIKKIVIKIMKTNLIRKKNQRKMKLKENFNSINYFLKNSN